MGAAVVAEVSAPRPRAAGGAGLSFRPVFSGPRTLAGRARSWIAQQWKPATLIAVIAALLTGGGVLAATSGEADPERVVVGDPAAAPAPRVVIREQPAAEETGDLGFPAFATKNTTRVAGDDPAADAAAVALAVYPSTGDLPGPDAITLVDADDWAAGIAAAVLTAAPVNAPILLTEAGEVPELSAEAAGALAPRGSKATGGDEAFAIGAAAVPDGIEALELEGGSPAEIAAEIAKLRSRLAGAPDHVVLLSDSEPALAMPAAGWAARSGDPVLYLEGDTVPKATRAALEDLEGVAAYVLGPQSAVSKKAFAEVRKLTSTATRIGAEDPVENAIEFARYAAGSFGWDINDPGHGLVLANADRPLDAAAAAPLSASGTWGPLLLTDDPKTLPEPLRNYLLDLKPGYLEDPTRAVYNHAWIIGDTEALSIGLQAQVDELAEVTQVTSGSGPAVVPSPGAPESQPEAPAADARQRPDPQR